MNNLLAKAQMSPVKTYKKTNLSSDLLELAVAWAHEEITITQVAYALDKKDVASAYSVMARALAEHVKTNNL